MSDTSRPPATSPAEESAPARGKKHVFSLVMMIVALVIGEALLIAVTKFCQWLVSPLVVAWLLASVIVAIGGYLIFGLPVLSVYRAAADRKATEPDIRGLWSERILKSGTRLAYVAGSIIGGSPAVAWYYGSRGDAHARSRTMGAAAITAAFWCAFYLGLLTWIFG